MNKTYAPEKYLGGTIMEIIVKFIDGSKKYFEFNIVKEKGKYLPISSGGLKELENYEDIKRAINLIVKKIEKAERKEVVSFQSIEKCSIYYKHWLYE